MEHSQASSTGRDEAESSSIPPTYTCTCRPFLPTGIYPLLTHTPLLYSFHADSCLFHWDTKNTPMPARHLHLHFPTSLSLPLTPQKHKSADLRNNVELGRAAFTSPRKGRCRDSSYLRDLRRGRGRGAGKEDEDEFVALEELQRLQRGLQAGLSPFASPFGGPQSRRSNGIVRTRGRGNGGASVGRSENRSGSGHFQRHGSDSGFGFDGSPMRPLRAFARRSLPWSNFGMFQR